MALGMDRFAVNPTNIDIKRSLFSRSSQHKTTMNAAELIPVFIDEVLPGDTFNVSTSLVCRMATPINPVMDNCNLDVYYFFVPNRLVWDHWKNFMGENTDSYWYPQTEYTIPQVRVEGSYAAGDAASYLGIPSSVNLTGFTFNALPLRGISLIWNEWFRDQNLQTPLYINHGDSEVVKGTQNMDHLTGVGCLPVNKYHDYFTSVLPQPQKGPQVTIPLGDLAAVITTEDTSIPKSYPMPSLMWSDASTGDVIKPASGQHTSLGLFTYGNRSGTISYNTSSGTDGNAVVPNNLYADLSGATAASINQLRQAFAVQRAYERDARGGTRYTEMIRAHFGVTSPDARQQRPEFLGGKRIPISMSQVVQTSASTDITPQGNTAAYSLTSDSSSSFTKSFTEHGYVIGVACIRTQHTYQQGVERMWTRNRRFDFYLPVFANLGEQAVKNQEIYVQGGNNLSQNTEVFGYQEAWAEYRYKPSRTSGYMRSTEAESLDVWHYGDNFSTKPVLNSDFMKETKVNIDRTLAVTSAISHQFICDFYFDAKVSRPMPVYSVPGLLDHN